MMEATFLQNIWFFLFFVLISGYAILDGFDLGVGVLSLFNRSDGERRLYVNAIAPVWDGNEVWLLTAGGALFAAFPPVYATVFSGFYLAIMLLLAGLIARAVSMEFRGRIESKAWRRFWDGAFGIGSLLPALLFGVAVGNILRGIPVDQSGEFTGTFLSLLNPFSLLIGVLGLIMFVTHGAVYMALKSEGELQKRMLGAASKNWIVWITLYSLATLYGFFAAPHLFAGTLSNPLFWLFFLLLLVSLLSLPLHLKSGKAMVALVTSSVAIISTIGVAATAMYPNLVLSSTNAAYSLTVAGASSTQRTLWTMLIIALVGMPIVIAYTIVIYRVFKGKVTLDEYSY
jgi:cytochrome d ubiquinol oxidase subunit II